MNYHFFDYKHNIKNFSSDLFSTPHIIFIILSFILVPIVCFLLRKTKKNKIELFLKIYSIVVALLEVTKVTWETYFDITTGHGFNIEGILPFYTCSLFIYTMLLAAYAKGKVKEFSISFITTVGLLSGCIGVVYCNGLNFYPFWTFGAFYSMIFHLSMFFVGMFLLITRYKKLEWSDMIKSWIPMVILSVIAIPANYEYGADYMQLYEGSGIPLFSTLAEKLANAHLRFIFTIIMLVTYIPFAGIVIGISKLTYLIIDKINKNKNLIK